MNRRQLAITALAGLIFTGGAGAPRPEAPAQTQELQRLMVVCELREMEIPAIDVADLRELRELRDLAKTLPAFGNSLHGPLLVSTPLPPRFRETPAALAPSGVDFPGRKLAETAALLLPEAIKVVMEAARRIDVVQIVHWFLA